MLRSLRVALAAAIASAAAAGAAHAQQGPGGRNFAPPPPPPYDYRYDDRGQQYDYRYDNRGPQFDGRNGPQYDYRYDNRGPRFGNRNAPQYDYRYDNRGPRFGGRNGNRGPQYDYRYNDRNAPPPDRFAAPRDNPRGAPNNAPAAPAANRGYLGIEIQPLNAGLADALKLPDQNGVLVSNVEARSPAAMAGIMAGDVILSVDGKATNRPADLTSLVGGSQPNMKVTVSVWRQGARQDIPVTLGGAPGRAAQNQGPANAPAPAGTAVPGLGLNLTTDRNGAVLVASVDQNGGAQQAGVRTGDQILSVGDAAVSTAADIGKAVDTAKQGGAKNVLLRLRSGQTARFVAVPVG